MSPTALRRHIGQLLIAGFDGHQIPVELKAIAREFGLGGVILFARNVSEPEGLAELCYEAARLVHFFAMAAIVGFIAIHVLMAFLVPKSLRAMITGR